MPDTTAGQEQPEMRMAKAGDVEHLYLFQLTEAMRDAGYSVPNLVECPRTQMTVMITAAAFLAGTLHGQLEVMGEIPKHMRKRMETSVIKNFRSGRGIGEKVGARALRDSVNGTA